MLSLNKHFIHSLAALLVLTLSGCAQFGNPITHTTADYSEIPTQTLEKIAQGLETEIQEGNRSPELTNSGDFKINSPAIAQALRSRAARAQLIEDLLNSGHTFEKKNGKIAILRSDAYKKSSTRQGRDRDALIIISENLDRVLIYKEFQTLNQLDPAARSAIEAIFFQARIALMSAGQQYEGSGGEAVAKQ